MILKKVGERCNPELAPAVIPRRPSLRRGGAPTARSRRLGRRRSPTRSPRPAYGICASPERPEARRDVHTHARDDDDGLHRAGGVSCGVRRRHPRGERSGTAVHIGNLRTVRGGAIAEVPDRRDRPPHVERAGAKHERTPGTPVAGNCTSLSTGATASYGAAATRMLVPSNRSQTATAFPCPSNATRHVCARGLGASGP